MFKSKAQMERCERLVKEGKMSQEQFDRHYKETDHQKLPHRIHPKKETR
jgi:hypothetical protein